LIDFDVLDQLTANITEQVLNISPDNIVDRDRLVALS